MMSFRSEGFDEEVSLEHVSGLASSTPEASLDAPGSENSESLTQREDELIQARPAAREREGRRDHLFLPNRYAFRENLREALVLSEQEGSCGAICLVQMERVRQIGATLGPGIVEPLLRTIVRRLREIAAARGGLVARWAANEFILLFPRVGENEQHSLTDTLAIISGIKRDLASPIRARGNVFRMSCNLGVTLFQGHAAFPTELLRQAELALYSSRRAGDGAVRFYSDGLQRAAERLCLGPADLWDALERGQMQITYHPRCLADGVIFGAEASIAWHTLDGVDLGLDQIIVLAEECGASEAVTWWMFDRICGKLATEKRSASSRPANVALSLPRRSLEAEDFVAQMGSVLRLHGISGRALTLEIDGASLRLAGPTVMGNVKEAREMGASVMVQVGECSFPDLVKFKKIIGIDQWKLDWSVLNDLREPALAEAALEAMAAFARPLGATIAVVGIETDADRQRLANMGVREFRGPIFAGVRPWDGRDD